MSLEKELLGICEEYIETTEYELVHLTYRVESGRKILRVMIDKKGGVTLDDCSIVSRAFEKILDERDIIEEQYVLEVSSPGVDRPLVKLNDYERFKDNEVKITLSTPIPTINEKRLVYRGYLIGIDGELIKVKTKEDELVSIPFSSIKKANIVYQF
ncbi:ribosome maturation factor RimP [bacterium]|nr:ribosome maturation factor RimP [bacterium]